jgi:hypothetical protein
MRREKKPDEKKMAHQRGSAVGCTGGGDGLEAWSEGFVVRGECAAAPSASRVFATGWIGMLTMLDV